MQAMLWTDVLMSHKFTALGAMQFMRDLNAIISLVERFIPNGMAPLGGLLDAVRLLNLPISPEGQGEVSLKIASDRVFTDNTEAKKMLEELGIDTLTPANARKVLQRRVENNE
jgi:RAD50-interacting protein 1